MMKFKTKGLVALFGVAALCFTAQAQQAPPPLIQVVRVVVKPDRVAEWREIAKQITQAHEKGSGGFRHVWRSRTGNPFEYVVVSPMANYEQLDSPGAVRQGMSEGERAALVARRRLCVESVEITYREPIPELTIPWTGDQPPKMITTSTTVVATGMAPSYVEHKKEQVTAFKKAGVPAYGVHRLRWGGSRAFVTWTARDKMADLDEPNWMEKGMGEEGAAKWRDKIIPMIESVEWNIWVYEPDLSYQTEQ